METAFNPQNETATESSKRRYGKIAREGAKRLARIESLLSQDISLSKDISCEPLRDRVSSALDCILKIKLYSSLEPENENESGVLVSAAALLEKQLVYLENVLSGEQRK